MEHSVQRLDDLYYMTAHIYSEQNAARPPETTFAHFVEVCGMLATYDRRKKREEFDIEDALCKALGWFFPLLARFKIASVEELVFLKYPYTCPYCRKTPHKDSLCKTVRGTKPTVNHEALAGEYARNNSRRPKSLTEWQRMFQEIYPRGAADANARSTLGLFEEIGELAEAIRVFDRFPKFFVGEAADVFSYLMGMANEYSLKVEMEDEREFSFEAEYMKRYPGLCTQCGNQVCTCPAIPDSTVGRMAKELGVEADHPVFLLDWESLHTRGREVSTQVMARLGRSTKWGSQLPFDRGAANRALVDLLYALADQTRDLTLQIKLREAALKAIAAASPAGSKEKPAVFGEIIGLLHDRWPDLAPASEPLVQKQSTLASQVVRALQRVRILFVAANPQDTGRLQVDVEERAIFESVRLSNFRDFVSVIPIHAATTDDLRRALLEGEYDVLHFSGHGAQGGPIFADLVNEATQAPIAALAGLIRRYPTIKCVLLNACWSLDEVEEPLADFTIGMSAPVGDRAAIEFARGFYDALGAGRNFEFAISEGWSAVELKGLAKDLPLKVLKQPPHTPVTT
jgi:NTP pyrophosphatase (non-canonical NTP hydrolase)